MKNSVNKKHLHLTNSLAKVGQDVGAIGSGSASTSSGLDKHL